MAKQLPIAFTADNAFKVQQDIKTQTRRLINLNSFMSVGDKRIAGKYDWKYRTKKEHLWEWVSTNWLINKHAKYQVGDLLWIQEPYIIYSDYAKYQQIEVGYFSTGAQPKTITLTDPEWAKYTARKYPNRKSPGRFMYKSLARTWVKVIDIRIERVNKISDEDAIAEGVEPWDSKHWRNYFGDKYGECISPNDSFATLWDSINGGIHPKPADEWKQFINGPYVWAYTFERIDVQAK